MPKAEKTKHQGTGAQYTSDGQRHPSPGSRDARENLVQEAYDACVGARETACLLALKR